MRGIDGAAGAATRLGERGDDILVERLAGAPGSLRAIEHGDRARRRGMASSRSVDRERPEQVHLDDAEPGAAAR